MAQEQAQVLSAVPVVQARTLAQQVCRVEQEVAPQQNTGTGAFLGMAVGGVAANGVGSGEGRALATLFGAVLGALWGDRVEGRPVPQMQQVRHCTLQGVLQPQVVGYEVQYEYAGLQYSTRLPHDPGPTLAVQVTPAPLQGSDFTRAQKNPPRMGGGVFRED
ncbi:glycine zipper 2TM domain-containing protein [Pseudorhodoferax sp. Leaf274]|uniref:glycine zipper 2TM domain-containing protein n=1 Tax=Pseudorhodoferax sp. Leaf274 TaxID=1736318 RepID=UPI00138F3731|nr:glycine zipper 2TM domain-containing protein [Pseudorhodoferax sp. Leaf274]